MTDTHDSGAAQPALHVITDQALKVIDVLASEGKETNCAATHKDVDLFDEALRAQGWTAYADLPEYRSRSPYRKSYWVRREDGRCAPEIFLLATMRYGIIPLQCEPRWSDGNPVNNKIENVVLVQVRSTDGIDGRLKRNKYGVASGTPEYRKAYYADQTNREKRKASVKKSAAKKRDQVKQAKAALDPAELKELTDRILVPRDTDQDASLARRLADPDVIKAITVQAQMIVDLTHCTIEEALEQARDVVLQLPKRVGDVHEGDPT